VISVEFARDARRRLEDAGIDLLYREVPIGHGVDPSTLPLLRAWLEETLELAAEARYSGPP
jgi:predicted esterase